MKDVILFWLNPCTFYPTAKCFQPTHYYMGKNCIHSRLCDAQQELGPELECDDGKYHDPDKPAGSPNKCPEDKGRPTQCSKFNMLAIKFC